MSAQSDNLQAFYDLFPNLGHTRGILSSTAKFIGAAEAWLRDDIPDHERFIREHYVLVAAMGLAEAIGSTEDGQMDWRVSGPIGWPDAEAAALVRLCHSFRGLMNAWGWPAWNSQRCNDFTKERQERLVDWLNRLDDHEETHRSMVSALESTLEHKDCWTEEEGGNYKSRRYVCIAKATSIRKSREAIYDAPIIPRSPAMINNGELDPIKEAMKEIEASKIWAWADELVCMIDAEKARRASVSGPRALPAPTVESVGAGTLGSSLEKAGSREPTKEEEWDAVGYLGLVVNRKKRCVRRDGETTVELIKRKLLWGLFLALLRIKDDYLSLDEVCQVWSEHGRSDEPSDSTVNDAISELRKLLKPLGVGISNAPTFGWMLADIAGA